MIGAVFTNEVAECPLLWLVGWLVGWVGGWVDGWLAGWLDAWLLGWSVRWMVEDDDRCYSCYA